MRSISIVGIFPSFIVALAISGYPFITIGDKHV